MHATFGRKRNSAALPQKLPLPNMGVASAVSPVFGASEFQFVRLLPI